MFRNLQQIFWVQNCRSQIAQVEYQSQARNSRNLERKPLINTFYCIQHRFELKYFHLAQFCFMLIKQLINLEKVRTASDNLKFRTHLRDRVMDTADDCLQRQTAQKSSIENQSLSCQRWSLQGFQKSHFICYWLGGILYCNQFTFPSFCAPPCEVAVLIDSNLSRRPCLGKVTDCAAKLWLQSNQNHTRRHFQAFARRYLKLLCCSIWIWAGALFLDKLST